MYGHSGAPRGWQPAGSCSKRGAHGRERGKGGCPGTAVLGRASVPMGYGVPVGLHCGVQGRAEGGAGRHPERSRKPASPSRPCLREHSFPADSLLSQGPSAGRCLPGQNTQIQIPLQPSSQVKDQKHLPCLGVVSQSVLLSLAPGPTASTAGWGCSYPAQAKLQASPR